MPPSPEASKHKTVVCLQFNANEKITKIAETIEASLDFEAKGRPLLSSKLTVSHIPSHIKHVTSEKQTQIQDCAERGEFEVLFTHTNRLR